MEDMMNTLAKNNDNILEITNGFKGIVNGISSGKGTIGKLVTDETLYNSINQTASNVTQFTSEGTKLLYDFRQNPKKFLRIKLALF